MGMFDKKGTKTSESDIEEVLGAVKAHANGLEKEQQKLVERCLQTNEHLSKLEADIVSLESAHTAVTEKLLKLGDDVDSLTLRFDGLAKAVAKIREVGSDDKV